MAEHTPLVSAIARSLLRKLPASVELDDLLQDGFVGLLVAVIQATTVQAGKRYEAYLTQRIRGAMLDGLRRNDPGSRKVRQQMRQVEIAISQLSQRLGRMPLESEVAAAMAMTLRDYQLLLQEADGYTLLSLEDFTDAEAEQDFVEWCASTNSNPLAVLERKAVQRALLQAISTLSEREEQLMNLYYIENKTMQQIAAVLTVTEGRVSQIHTQIIAKLRAVVLGDSAQASLLQPRWRLE